MKKTGWGLIFLLSLAACKQTGEKAEEKALSAQDIIDKSIAVSGGEKFDKKRITFNFRGTTYVSERKNWHYQLERITTDSVKTTRDVLNNDGFSRYIDEKPVTVPDSMVSRYSNSVNAVHYFAYLPYGLNDKAVQKELLGEVTIKGKEYYKIKVTFEKEGGGKDHEDIYVYWIDREAFTVDYLAYQFQVNGGGMRFREAYHPRTVKGIRFVDYHNFKPATPGATLYELDRLFEAGKLEPISEIVLEDIRVEPVM